MELIEDLYNDYKSYLPFLVPLGAVVVTGIIAKRLLSNKTGPGKVTAPPNTAIIYQVGRGPYAPSISPFVVKLETFCRLAKIPYVVDTTGRFSSRGKIPWMTYNGEVVEDSQFCIEYFNNKLGTDFNSHLSTEEKAVARFIQVLVDEHLYWAEGLFRIVYYAEDTRKHMEWPRLISFLLAKKKTAAARGQGMGRHSQTEVNRIMMEDLQRLADYLGTKPYMLGDEMCEADCSVFGLLAQFVWQPFNDVMRDLLKDKFPNLHQYCHRIRDKLWPDWDECCKS